MKMVIAGSRHIKEAEALKLINMFFEHHSEYLPTQVLSGRARGVDLAGEKFALSKGIPIAFYPAQWDQHGPSAGHIRNAKMAIDGDVLLLIWDGKSKGSANMKKNMQLQKKHVYEFIYGGEDGDHALL